MLKDELAKATGNEVKEYLMHRTPHGGTWLEHCLKNDWSVAQMMNGFDRWKHQETVIEHEPPKQPLTKTTARRSLSSRLGR